MLSKMVSTLGATRHGAVNNPSHLPGGEDAELSHLQASLSTAFNHLVVEIVQASAMRMAGLTAEHVQGEGGCLQ
jgi:hypothetical protein